MALIWLCQQQPKCSSNFTPAAAELLAGHTHKSSKVSCAVFASVLQLHLSNCLSAMLRPLDNTLNRDSTPKSGAVKASCVDTLQVKCGQQYLAAAPVGPCHHIHSRCCSRKEALAHSTRCSMPLWSAPRRRMPHPSRAVWRKTHKWCRNLCIKRESSSACTAYSDWQLQPWIAC